jgi:Cas10/Cmr2, second palm domain
VPDLAASAEKTAGIKEGESPMNLVLIETSGNQRYIFSTNKLRENVGASELTYRVGTEAVLQEVARVTRRAIYEENDLAGVQMRANLLNPDWNPPLQAGGCSIEVITATSGKALLLVENEDIGKNIVRSVTERALHEMPGLTVHGAISEPFGELARADFSGVHEAIGAVHRKLERLRFEMPSNEQRFLRLPFVAPCETSGSPASEAVFLSKEEREKNEAHRFSMVALAKRNALRDANEDKRSRIVDLLNTSFGISLYENPELLEKDFKELNWIAVVHADGNGLGEIFRSFDKHTGLTDRKCTEREYIEKYRRFSLALDVCTINAAGEALGRLQQRFRAEEEENTQRHGRTTIQRADEVIPVVPLILGGDDLTLICDGQYALKLVCDFLTQFERETQNITAKEYLKGLVGEKTVLEILGNIIPEIADSAFHVGRLGICAGVAIVKPHFPFHQAYELAESLLRSAKEVKSKTPHPSSALDFHILYDSTASELSLIRESLKTDDGASWLFARPYVVSEYNDSLPPDDWVVPRRWRELEKRVASMLTRDAEDQNRRRLPNSQLHALREALFLGKHEADAHARLVHHRYKDEGFQALLCSDENDPSLFFEEQHDGKAGHTTHFLDALDIVEFRKGEEVKDGRQKLSDK